MGGEIKRELKRFPDLDGRGARGEIANSDIRFFSIPHEREGFLTPFFD